MNKIVPAATSVKTSASQLDKLNAFPLFVKVEGRIVVIIGHGDEALAKARLIAQSSAQIRIVSAHVEPALAAWIDANGAEHRAHDVTLADIEDAAFIFTATEDAARDRQIVELARANRIPANAVDRPELCDFFTPALVNRAPVAIAIGTEGAGPVLAQMLRAMIDRLLSPSLGPIARLAARYRVAAETHLPKGNRRRQFWRELFEGAPARAVEAGDLPRAERQVEELLATESDGLGHVSLVGAGPGAEDLLTLRAHRLLMQADVIVHDALVPQAVIDMGRRDAERIAAGKRKGCHSKSQAEINALLVSLAREGKRVVRLKAGDPLIFGRAGEEMQALRDARISYDVVPGVTAAFAAAADFELPLTLRGVSSSIVFTTGHDLRGGPLPDWAKLAIGGATVAVYMGRSIAAEVASRLIAAGLSPDTAVAIVENASQGAKKLLHGTLADLPGLEQRTDLTGPVMTIIGDSVAGANFTHSTPLGAHQTIPVAA